MTKILISPDNQIIWADSAKSAVALFGFVYLCRAIGFGSAGSYIP